MPKVTTTLPQTDTPITLITFRELIAELPQELKYPLNVWIGGKLARYGQTSDNLCFLVEQDDETSTELKLYFQDLTPFIATVSHAWRNEKLSAIRLYNEGKLIIDKKTLTYTKLPSPTKKTPIITLDEIKSKMPKQIKWKQAIYIVGSTVKNGWSGNDVDFMTEDPEIFKELRIYFTELLGYKVDVANARMPEREPVYKFKLYENGKCLL